ncbi:MAG: CHASE3 domain-containing protein [Verrucomicrobiae bacterium]|nr:CHASE3 domain-containing protein [Verrucomicrobiae bacterium]
MFRQPSNEVYRTVVVVWLTLSAASVVLAAITWIELSRHIEASRQAAAIQAELDAVFQVVLDTETSQRGFTLTGDDAFLVPLEVGEEQLPARFERLIELTRGDAASLQRIMDLRVQAQLLLNHHQSVVLARQHAGYLAAAEIVMTGDGRRMMETLRTQVAEIRGMRSDLLSDDGAQARAQMFRAVLTSLLAGVLGIGAGLFAFRLSRLSIRHQERERELVEARLEAERSSREKTVFLANMSHEIRTPMNAILGFSELLSGDLTEPRHRQYLSSIRSSARSLLQLINDILDMSKIEAGVMELHPEPTDPAELCGFVRSVFSEAAARKGVPLECEVAAEVPRSLLLDRIRLRQILINLVGNALKFTDRGWVRVRVPWEPPSSDGRVNLTIEVSDTGVGIPPDRLEAIFEPFVQAGADREKEREGTGLGLAIVRRLTEAMGGTVSVTSQPGEGSTFRLRLPGLTVSPRLPAEEGAPEEDDTDFNRLAGALVLVVDDNRINCDLVAGMFEGSHHRLEFGHNGEEAVAKARLLRPDVILMDVRMPGMDGRAALAAIRQTPGFDLLPVIAVTASSLADEEEGLKRQFSGYLQKPFTRRDLFAELAQFLPRAAGTPPNASHTGTARPAEAVSGAPDSPGQPTPASLAVTLARLHREVWPRLREMPAFNACRDFARELESVGHELERADLIDYARTLREHAENYAVVELEEHLGRFGELADRLEARPTS